MPQKLHEAVKENSLTARRTDFRSLNPLSERLLDPPLIYLDLYKIATESYLIKYIDAYKTAFHQAKLEKTVSASLITVTLLYLFFLSGSKIQEARLIQSPGKS